MRPEPAPMHLDDRGALGVLEHVGHRRLLHVEDLAADRQQRLVLRVAGQLGRAERRVALDDEQLAAVDVVAAAVDELGRQRRGLERVLAALGLLVLRGPRSGSSSRRRPSRARSPGLLPCRRAWRGRGTAGQLAARRPWPRSADAAGVPSTSLVWPSNCGSGSRTVTTAVRPASTSSLSTASSPTLSSRASLDLLVAANLISACSKPVSGCRPWASR